MTIVDLPSVAPARLRTEEERDRLIQVSLKLGSYLLNNPVNVTFNIALRLATLLSTVMVKRGGYEVVRSKSVYQSVPRYTFQKSMSEASI